ncbi:fibrinogen-like protein 1-like protein [Hyperolius riggenbachi]|uniref:fibrinogen-like protein 1-like protein n=1 Tax=Hyperolius riggenbachi TaxID=752182 RepID=UPI0035A3339E
MVPHWTSRLVFPLLVTLLSCDALTHVTREKLYGQIANRHLLTDAQLEGLLNVPASGVYRELVAKDCRAAYLNMRRNSGLYVLWPKDSPPFVVYCDVSSSGAGWTVLQRKTWQDHASFGSSSWDDYRNGFGDLLGSHWLGNELIYLITRQNVFTVRFLLVDSQGNSHYADYDGFRVDSEANGYALRLGNYSGDAGDALTVWNETGVHDNMKFSTKDRDNDRWDRNCAEEWKGGWWFDNCQSAVLNTDGNILWGAVCSNKDPCVATSIMIKPSRMNCSPMPLPGAGGYPPIHYS